MSEPWRANHQAPSEPWRANHQAPSDPEPIALAWCGPDRHGICQLAERIARSATQQGFTGAVLAEPDPDRLFELVDRLPPGVRLLHLQANDWLFSQGHGRGAERLIQFAELLDRRDAALSVTLHDLPQPADGRELYPRRATGYAQLARLAAGVVVCSDHERTLLDNAGRVENPSAAAVLATVIPLPIDSFDSTAAAPIPRARSRTVGIFGFVYPGKGHREVLDELAGLPDPPDVLAIGGVSPGHDHLLDELVAVGRSRGIRFRTTGYLPDADVPRWLQRVGVPVAPHTRVSASASIHSWIAAGRRPLVPAGRYSDELDERLPGSVRIYQPGQLREYVEIALVSPEITDLPAGLAPPPDTAEVTRRYLAWLRLLADGVGRFGRR